MLVALVAILMASAWEGGGRSGWGDIVIWGGLFVLWGGIAVFSGGIILAVAGGVARLALAGRNSRTLFLVLAPPLMTVAVIGAIWGWPWSTLNQATPAPSPPAWAPPGGYDSNVVLNTLTDTRDRWGSVTDRNKVVYTCARTYAWALTDTGADWQLYAVDTILVDPEGRDENRVRTEACVALQSVRVHGAI